MDAVSRLTFTPINFRKMLPDSVTNLVGSVSCSDEPDTPESGAYHHHHHHHPRIPSRRKS